MGVNGEEHKYRMRLILDKFGGIVLTGGVWPVGLEIMAFQHPGGGKAKHQAPKWRADVEK